MINTFSYSQDKLLVEQLKANLSGRIARVEPFLGSCLNFYLVDDRTFGVMYCEWTIQGSEIVLSSDSCRSDRPEDFAFLSGRLIHTVRIEDDTVRLSISGDYQLMVKPKLRIYDQDDALISIDVPGGYMAILPNERVEVEVDEPQ